MFRNGTYSIFSFLVSGLFLANGVSHLFQFISLKDYVPGIVTFIIVIYPYSIFTLKHLLKEKLITMKKILGHLFLGFILQVPFALLSLWLARLLF
ncbi:HXXEE domain-containing protein [Peribacillus loiseleuriae]|uniref:HXXEE domain-containing protein n=1 Tax=Peribacillus loiseleuriae TaxID=1679170 RepID=UPI0009E212E1